MGTNVSLEGLDGFYDVAPDGKEEQSGYSTGTASNAEESPGIARWLTVEEASKRLGISANAVIKRLGKGKLPGRKVAEQYGEKWLVNPEVMPKEVHVELSDGEADGTAQDQPGYSKGTASGSQAQAGTSPGLTEKSFEILAEVVRQQTEQIKL